MKTKDSRGNAIRGPGAGTWWKLSPRFATGPAKEGEVSIWGVGLAILLYFGGGIALGAVVQIPFESEVAAGWAVGLSSIVWIAGFVFCLRKWLMRSTIQSALAQAKCPSCGYSLRGIEPQEDGCSLCPECGAAWKL